MSVHLYRPSRAPYRRGAPIVSEVDLVEAAHTQYTETPVIWSFWAADDNPWASTSSDTLIDLHARLRLPVLPWVAELRAIITAQDAAICIEDGAEALFDEAAPETREVVLAVTPAEAGSTRTDHRLQWRRRGGSGTADVYGGVLYLRPVSTLPTGV